jgi:hypothetical protein
LGLSLFSFFPCLAPPPPPPLLLGGCLALAALSLLAPSSPSYDPFAWIVWGRELVGAGQTFGVAGGPSWKPLPVLFTAPFSLAGDAAPALWLLVARTGLLLALAGAYRLATRLGGRGAGLAAAAALLLLDGLVSLAWRGASEPLLLACVLWAIERHIAGRRGGAFALGVAAALIRPEAWPFLALYAAWRWRAGLAPRERWLLLGGLALIPALWLGVPAIGGDPLAASTTASSRAGDGVGAGTALRRGLELGIVPVWVLAAAALALRPGDRTLRALALAAAAWLALVVAMTAAGYAGVARYMLPAAAVACVIAGVGVTTLLAHARARGAWRIVIAAAILAVIGPGIERAATLDDQVREGVAVAHAHDDLVHAIDASGGPAALRGCALGGWVAINHTAQSALAWELRVPLDRVALTMSRPGVLVGGARSAATGASPSLTLPNARRRTLARAGAWRVDVISGAGASLSPRCKLMPPGGV